MAFALSGEIIPSEYSSAYLEPADMDQETEKFGAALTVEDLTDGASSAGFFSSRLTPENNDLAIQAFREAEEQYRKLPGDERSRTSISQLAMRRHGELVSQRETEKPAKVDSPMAKTAQDYLAEAKADIEKRRRGRRGAKRKSGKAPAPGPKKKAKAFANLPQAAEKQKASPIGEVLEIDDLGESPAHAEIVCQLKWQTHGELGEMEFLAHWGEIFPQPDAGENGVPSHLIVLCIDVRDELAASSFDVSRFEYDASQTMSIHIDAGDNKLDFQVIQAVGLHRHGIFQYIQFFLPPNDKA